MTALKVRPSLQLLFVASVLATAQVAMAHQRLEMATQQNHLQREARQLQGEISRMNIELATLARPDRLRRVAVEKLGMRPPSAMQVVRW